MNDSSADTIQTIRHSMYIRAERWWWIALGCVVVGGIAALLLVRPIFPQDSPASTAIFLVSVVAPVLAAIARWLSGHFSGRADLCRRAFLYRDALGADLSIDERRIVALWPANTPLNDVTKQAPYFSSGQQRGPTRLADAVSESAFYTAELARKVSYFGLALVGVVFLFLISAVSALATLSLGSAQGEFDAVIGIVAVAALTLFTCEILVVAIGYGSLAKESESVFRSACQFQELSEHNLVTALRLAESYSIALAANLPIPNFLYRWHRNRIDHAYRTALSR